MDFESILGYYTELQEGALFSLDAEEAERRKREPRMTQKTVSVETTAQAYLELLRERGVEFFFANAGTDFAPIIDGFARFEAEGKSMPKPIVVPHENAAVAMAHGYYLVTGKPQVVMVHVTVGTGNALTGIMNAARDQVPIIFTAGRSPLVEAGLPGARDLFIHWSQESFDQAAMVREYVKWDYELRNFTQLEAVVDRALEMAMTPPRGPVYLTLPREVLAETHTEFSFTSPARRHLGGRLYPDPDTIEKAARTLGRAVSPLIITSSVGRQTDAVEPLVRLAERFAIPVVVFNPGHMCFPTDHPMHVGFDLGPFIGKADVILVVESDVPWYPSVETPPPNCQVIQMGIDPFYSTYPIRGFPHDMTIRSDPGVALRLLLDAMNQNGKPSKQEVASRFDRIRAVHDDQRLTWKQALKGVKDDSPLDFRWISHCIDEVKDDDTIIVNEYRLSLTQVAFQRPGTFFFTSRAAGLGWGLGASLGMKLGAPDRLVIAALGDGSYIFANPTACHFLSESLELPTLTIIFNNRIWDAVREANLGMYPEGWASKTGNFPLTELEPSPRFEILVTASGGYGERVEKASEVQPALKRALKAVREEGRQAVLNMVCKTP
jgi:acetolactate synthase-1/2/3 large subunit